MSSVAKPDRDRLWRQLEELSEFREGEQGGWTRRLFSAPYRSSRGYVLERMAQAGLAAAPDRAGNLVGELAGLEPGLPAIVLGSHTDTVAEGGRFDGPVGVLAALEVARLAGPLRHPLRVVDFLGEEPNRFGLSCVGSRAVAGQLTRPHLELVDRDGLTLEAALSAVGCLVDSPGLPMWRGEGLLAYLELHIEQGRQLERLGAQVGAVTAIAGIHRGRARLAGRADHAGTTVMADRRDALAGAAELVLAVERMAADPDGGDGVGTVGRLEALPGAANVVPGQATAWLELRSAAVSWLRNRHRRLELELEEIGRRRQLEPRLEWISAEPPVVCDRALIALIREAAADLGEPCPELISGASHDAAHLAALCPVGMIFVPSRDGRSHCPEEWTEPNDVALGARALLAAVLRLDRLDRL